MSFARMNKAAVQTVRDGIDTKVLEFKTLKDFIGKKLEVGGFYFHSKGHYGEQVVIIAREEGTKQFYAIDCPKWCVEDFKELRDDGENMALLMEGKMRLVDIAKKTTKNGTTTAYRYADGEATTI